MTNYSETIEQLTKAVENHQITEIERIYGYLSKEDIPKEKMDVVDDYVKAAYKYWTDMN